MMQPSSRMLLTSMVSEARRNVSAGATRAAILFVICFLCASGVLLWNLKATVDVLHAAARYRAAGASVIVVSSEGLIDGKRCEDLSDLPNVRAAGAIRAARDQLYPAATPGVPLPTYDVSPHFLKTFSSHDEGEYGVFVSDAVMDAFGLRVGDSMALDQGRSVPVAGAFEYPDDGRRAGLGFAAAQTVAASELFDECWVDTWPESAQVEARLAAAVVTASGADSKPPLIGQLNSTLGSRFDGPNAYAQRPTTLLPGVLVGVGLMIGMFAVGVRRLELADARRLGIRMSDQALHVLLESVAWLFGAAALSFGVTLIVTYAVQAAVVWEVVAYSSAAVGSYVLGGVAGILLGLGMIDSRKMAKYFRER